MTGLEGGEYWTPGGLLQLYKVQLLVGRVGNEGMCVCVCVRARADPFDYWVRWEVCVPVGGVRCAFVVRVGCGLATAEWVGPSVPVWGALRGFLRSGLWVPAQPAWGGRLCRRETVRVGKLRSEVWTPEPAFPPPLPHTVGLPLNPEPGSVLGGI